MKTVNMKVLFLTLVVLASLAMAKGNTIDVGLELICQKNKENPEKMKEIKECDKKIFDRKASWLPDAVETCKKNIVSEDKLDEFWDEVCDEGQEAKLQQFNNCLAENFEKAEAEPESMLIEMIKKCI